jgi:signal peptidase I
MNFDVVLLIALSVVLTAIFLLISRLLRASITKVRSGSMSSRLERH